MPRGWKHPCTSLVLNSALEMVLAAGQDRHAVPRQPAPFPPSLGWVILLCINPQRYSELQERKMNLGPGLSRTSCRASVTSFTPQGFVQGFVLYL